MGRRTIITALTFMSSALANCEDFEELANAPVLPKTCNGDWVLRGSVFYWSAQQGGMDFAISNEVRVPVVNPDPEEIQELNVLNNDRLEGLKDTWEVGYKAGVGYHTPCDGWDLDLTWSHFSPKSHTDVSADATDNKTLIVLWSAFSPAQGEMTFARDIEADWKICLDWVDFELGRAFWTGKRLSLRPFAGLRYANLRQNLDMEFKGGSWSPRIAPSQDPLTGEASLKNDYHGVGLRSGMNTVWHFGCGWALYGDLATGILCGSFDFAHQEKTRLLIDPFSKSEVLDAKSKFKASRAVVDMGLGIQWSTLICGCKYGIAASLGWEQHYFFHQNQMWRVVLIGDTASGNTGENVYEQRSGSLSTEGVTLSLEFLF